jgi:TM2 domain-containing membrane protein YozV
MTKVNCLTLAKSLGITILLAVLVSGVGHIYLGIVKRGIIILIVSFAIYIIAGMLFPEPYNWIIGGAYWIWQLVDVIRLYKKMKLNIQV